MKYFNANPAENIIKNFNSEPNKPRCLRYRKGPKKYIQAAIVPLQEIRKMPIIGKVNAFESLEERQVKQYAARKNTIVPANKVLSGWWLQLVKAGQPNISVDKYWDT